MNHRAFICTGLAFVLGLALCKAHAQGPEGYTYLGSEGETVTLSERSNVAYGANGAFHYKYAIIGTITLNNSVFGDPAPGVVKSGYYQPVSDQPMDNLIAYWPFDEGAGDVAYDRKGDNHGQITGCTWVLPGKIGDSAIAGASGSKIDCGPGPTPTTQDLTLTWWMIDNHDGAGTIMNKSVTGSGYGYNILVRSVNEDSPLRFRIGGWQSYGGWGSECRVPQGAYSDGEWVHVTCTYDSATDTATIYVNGELKENGAYNPKTGIAGAGGYCDGLNHPDTPLYIRGGQESFNGTLDEVAIWDVALTPDQVQSVYESGVSLSPGATDQLSAALTMIKKHLMGTAPLTETQINEQKELVASQLYHLPSDPNLIENAMEIIAYYEANEGPMFINARTRNGYPREVETADGRAIDRAIFAIQQGVHNLAVNDLTIAAYPHLIDGLMFETSSFFPGAAEPPVNPSILHSVKINASMPTDWGKPTAFSQTPVRRPTGCYLAPGSMGKVIVPAAMVNNGYSILVGAHTRSKTVKSTIKRFDQVTKTYDITSTETIIANPFGGGIYIIVPYEADLGVLTVELINVIRSPFYSSKRFHQTTLAEWRDIERKHPGPWADFETEKFMMQVPTSWIYNFDDPVALMESWDTAMDGVSELLGYPLVRNNVVLYLQVDVSISHSVYGIGYPQINNTYDPARTENGNKNHWLLRNPLNFPVEFHELGHAQLFSKFPGHAESMVNLLYVYVATEKFDVGLVEAFTDSMVLGHLENMSVDQAALTWMVTENFRNGNPMNITNSTKNEVRYQHRGYGRYVDIATLFGWNVLSDFYHQEHLDFMAGTPGDGLHQVDSRILRLSQAAGLDLTPLIHCWGVHPVNPGDLKAAIAAQGLPASKAIYDRLIHYKNIIPADNAQFWDHYLTIYPSQPGGGHPDYQYGWYNVWKNIYNETHGTAAKKAMQDIIDLYYSDIRIRE